MALVIDEQEAPFARIAITPIATLDDLAVRCQAVTMELLDSDLILDEAARRRVLALNRALQPLARSGGGLRRYSCFRPSRDLLLTRQAASDGARNACAMPRASS